MKARITVTLKAGVLDPQGKAIEGALASLGFAGVEGVRQGKVFDIELAESDPAKAEALGAKFKADRVSGDNNAIIHDDRVGAVIVSTSEPEHAAPVIEALRLGKPVFVEKPIALTLDDADRMIEAADAAMPSTTTVT